MHGWTEAKEGEETSSEDLAVTRATHLDLNMNTNISLNVIHVSSTIRIEFRTSYYKGFPICTLQMSH